MLVAVCCLTRSTYAEGLLQVFGEQDLLDLDNGILSEVMDILQGGIEG